ncbi:unnamed protein product, partial [Rotaria magnacalcarata]
IEKEIPPVSSNIKYRMKIDLEFHDWKDAPDIQTLSIDERLRWRIFDDFTRITLLEFKVP